MDLPRPHVGLGMTSLWPQASPEVAIRIILLVNDTWTTTKMYTCIGASVVEKALWAVVPTCRLQGLRLKSWISHEQRHLQAVSEGSNEAILANCAWPATGMNTCVGSLVIEEAFWSPSSRRRISQ